MGKDLTFKLIVVLILETIWIFTNLINPIIATYLKAFYAGFLGLGFVMLLSIVLLRRKLGSDIEGDKLVGSIFIGFIVASWLMILGYAIAHWLGHYTIDQLFYSISWWFCPHMLFLPTLILFSFSIESEIEAEASKIWVYVSWGLNIISMIGLAGLFSLNNRLFAIIPPVVLIVISFIIWIRKE